MKHTAFILLLFMSAHSFGQAVLQPIVELDGGFARRYEYMYVPKWESVAAKIDKSSLYTNFTLGAEYKKISLITQTSTYFNPSKDSYTFAPWLAYYEIKLFYSFKDIEIGATHNCKHLVKSTSSYNFEYGGGQEHVYIKWKIK